MAWLNDVAAAIEQFKAAMQAAGLKPPGVIEPGKLHRFPTNGKGGDDAGWCKLFPDMRGGVFGDHRSGLSEHWQPKTNRMTASEREAFQRMVAESKHQARARRTQTSSSGSAESGSDPRRLSVGCRGRRPEVPSGESPSARSSVKPSSAANDNLIDQTIELWQPRRRHELSREDARQIVENVTGFFSILAEWSRGEATTPANDIGDQADRETGEGPHEG